MDLLPVSGYVLAGGKSSRMGVDKAALMLGGRPLIALAVEKLAGICGDVAIVGNRNDLEQYAPVVMEARRDVGPGAGIEAGLKAARQDWCLFIPVDVPLLPKELLLSWVVEVLAIAKDDAPVEGGGVLRGSYLRTNGQPQPSICMLHRDCLAVIVRGLYSGEHRLRTLFEGIDSEFGVGSFWVRDAAAHSPLADVEHLVMERWFLNVNTPADLAEAEGLLRGEV